MDVRRRRRAILTAALVGALVVSAPLTASALWQSSAVAPPPVVNAGSLARPVATCTNVTVQGLGAARISWQPVTGATGYRLTLRNNVNDSTTVLEAKTTATSFDVRGNLLSGLGLVLGTLLTGGSIFVVVTATNDLDGTTNTWSGPPSAGTPVGLESRLLGLLGGIKCT